MPNRLLLARALLLPAACALAVVACADPDPTTVHVSPVGNDAEDGIAAPVKTLRRAVEMAFADGQITTIALAAGRYGAANGETYPYTVPAHVTIEGPLEGEAVLAGDRSAPGLVLETGELRDLALEDFSIAITTTLNGRLANVRIESGDVAVRVEPSAILAATDLAITGAAGACGSGIQLGARARFTARRLVTRMLGAHVDAREQSLLDIQGAQLSGDPACPQAVLGVAGTQLSITSATFEGGRTAILFAAPPESPTRATLTDTTIKGAAAAGLAGAGVELDMKGGALSGNGHGVDATGGGWWLHEVAITGNGSAVRAQGTQKMQIDDSTVTGNGTGIHLDVQNFARIQRNTIINDGVGLVVTNPAGMVVAPDNTWRANVQGADAQGRYALTEIIGPASGENYSIASGVRVLLWDPRPPVPPPS
jgi:hypothetical protein